MLADGVGKFEAEIKYLTVKVAGLCPEKKGVIVSELNSILQNRPGSVNDQAAKQLNTAPSEAEIPSERFKRNQEVVRGSLKESERLVYDRLVSLKLNTTELNVDALASAVVNSGLSEQRLDDLAVLANETFPKDFFFK